MNYELLSYLIQFIIFAHNKTCTLNEKILIFIFIILAKIANASDENHPINIGCEILLDTKEDLSHISDSLRYFQNELNNNT